MSPQASMLGLHCSRSWLKKSDSLQHIQSYRDSEASAGQLATRNGVLIEYETLELRCNPPQITIANDSKEDVTVVTMDSANRPGTLVEVRKQDTSPSWSFRKSELARTSRGPNLPTLTASGVLVLHEGHVSTAQPLQHTLQQAHGCAAPWC